VGAVASAVVARCSRWISLSNHKIARERPGPVTIMALTSGNAE
jgi:hypothetical protein